MLAVSCQTGPTKLGETFTEQAPRSVDEVVRALQAGETLSGVQLAGKVDKNCMEKGCWLSMMSSDGTELLMTFKDEAFTIPINTVGRQVILSLSGRFDYTVREEFLKGVDTALVTPSCGELVVDLAGVDYLDSSALGMLLMLRDRCKGANKAVSLANCRGAVKQVLDIANFSRLFPME